MDYLPPIQHTCPVEIAVSLKSLNLADERAGRFLDEMSRIPNNTRTCMSLLVGYMSANANQCPF